MGSSSDEIWDLDTELASGLGDAVCVIAPDGLIVWVNVAMANIMDSTRAALLGTSGFSMVHPDEMARAVDGLDYAQQFPGRTAAAPFRIITRSGAVRYMEIKTGVITRGGVDYVTVVARDASVRRVADRALKSIAGGEPLEHTVALVGEVVQTRWPNSGTAVVLPDGSGGCEIRVIGLEGPLEDHARGDLRGPDGLAPWELARGADPVVVVDEADLPEGLRNAARAQGFAGFGVAPLSDRGGDEGCLIVWFDHTIIARLEFVHAATELTELLTIALDRRNLHREMWWAARCDSLTGLLNRFGFLEHFDDHLRTSRLYPELVTVLFFLDLDGLKVINDRFGHAAGDRALCLVAQRLAAVADGAVTARLGGDEFAMATTVRRDDADQQTEEIAAKLLAAFAAEAGADDVDGGSPRLAASVGAALDQGSGDAFELIERADAAMYRAKSQGPARWSR